VAAVESLAVVSVSEVAVVSSVAAVESVGRLSVVGVAVVAGGELVVATATDDVEPSLLSLEQALAIVAIASALAAQRAALFVVLIASP
jgi:hypothetical protein